MAEQWWKGNDVILRLKGVTAKTEDGTTSFLNAATVVARILDLEGNEVQAWGYSPQTLGHIAGSNGDYAKIADKAVIANIPDGEYDVQYTATEGDADYEERVLVTIGRRRA